MSTAVTFGRSFTVVPTYECFNRCGYCNFRRGSPVISRDAPIDQHPGWLRLDAVPALLQKATGGDEPKAVELLVLAGEVAPKSRARAAWHRRIVDICKLGLRHGILPHTNAGPLSREEMEELADVNASMGLMVESVADLPVHRWAPSKRPGVRLQQLEMAGELRIPFTTGLLLGIGETPGDREATLAAIAASQSRHGHIQEVILQPHSVGQHQPYQGDPGWAVTQLPDVVALARRLLPPEVAIQVPPNLVWAHRDGPTLLRACLDAGARDLGGVSPLDEVNPDFDFPPVTNGETPQRGSGTLEALLRGWGYHLRETCTLSQ